MKTLIIALNSKYIHSSLAAWYLKASCGTECGMVNVAERTVNENIDAVLSSIYLQKPDVAAFSCYIWNIEYVMKLAPSLKKLLPGLIIVLGGPEGSYDAAEILKEHGWVDYVLAGEGEKTFPLLLKYLDGRGSTPGEIPFAEGFAFRTRGGIRSGRPSVIEKLDDIPSPYTEEMLKSLKNKIAYFETSRGCPFCCSYCLSSASAGVRYFSMERVFADLDKLVLSGVKQIKFVDRTFNFNRKRAREIIDHILIKYGDSGCNFHFEVGADLFDDELIRGLGDAPKGLFQLEAGMQSANPEVLASVCRKTNLAKLLSNLNKLRAKENIHIHADLIAGLPKEDYASFGKSFDILYNARPHQIQLGFLKFLKGTVLRSIAEKEGFKYSSFAPYEILLGKWMRYDELIVLKGIAELVERYYNSGRFSFSLDHIIHEHFRSPFHFFESFYRFHRDNALMEMNAGIKELFIILDDFAAGFMKGDERRTFRETLKLDFLASDCSGRPPEFLAGNVSRGFYDLCFDFLREKDNILKYLPEAAGMTAKQIFKKVHFERFDTAVILFDYRTKDKVTGRYPFYKVDL